MKANKGQISVISVVRKPFFEKRWTWEAKVEGGGIISAV